MRLSRQEKEFLILEEGESVSKYILVLPFQKWLEYMEYDLCTPSWTILEEYLDYRAEILDLVSQIDFDNIQTKDDLISLLLQLPQELVDMITEF